MKDHTHIDVVLEKSRPTMSEAASARVWSGVAKALLTTRPVASPYQFSWLPLSRLAPIALVLVIVFGVGSVGTYAAAEASKPGDFLFPIERALEDLRLSLASEGSSETLRAEFARERLLEIQALIDAELGRLDTTNATTSATTTPSVVVSGATRTRIDTGIDELLLLMGGLRGVESRDSIFAELVNTVDDITVREDDDDDGYRLRVLDDGTRVEIRGDDDDSRSEIREGDSRVRIRDKDGEIRIDVKDDDRDDDNRSSSQTSTQELINEAEANVFTDSTEVKVERSNGTDITFTTTARTRSAVIAEIARRTGATEAAIDAVLDFEVENRASRSDDSDDSEARDNDRDDDNRSDDDGRDDDNQVSPSEGDDEPIRRIDVEVKRTVAEVEVEYSNGSKERFILTYSTRVTLVSDLALRLGLTVAEAEALLRLEIDND